MPGVFPEHHRPDFEKLYTTSVSLASAETQGVLARERLAAERIRLIIANLAKEIPSNKLERGAFAIAETGVQFKWVMYDPVANNLSRTYCSSLTTGGLAMIEEEPAPAKDWITYQEIVLLNLKRIQEGKPTVKLDVNKKIVPSDVETESPKR
jgi:hypothetical protein